MYAVQPISSHIVRIVFCPAYTHSNGGWYTAPGFRRGVYIFTTRLGRARPQSHCVTGVPVRWPIGGDTPDDLTNQIWILAPCIGGALLRRGPVLAAWREKGNASVFLCTWRKYWRNKYSTEGLDRDGPNSASEMGEGYDSDIVTPAPVTFRFFLPQWERVTLTLPRPQLQGETAKKLNSSG